MTVSKACGLDSHCILSQDISTMKQMEEDSKKILEVEEKYREVTLKALTRKIM